MAYPGSFDHQSNVNPTQLTRQGALNGGSDPRALYLKLFSGEMFKGFQHESIARDMVMKRTLKNGNLYSLSTQVEQLLSSILPEIQF